MLTTLIESRRPRSRTAQAQALSIGLHAVLISAALAATQHAARVLEPVNAEPVTFVRPTEAPAPQPVTPTIDVARPRGFRLLPLLISIPSVLPEIDLSRALTDPRDFIPVGVPGGSPDGVDPSSVQTAMTAADVDVPARLLVGSGRPSYPEALRSAGMGGEVNVQFVIDSTGRADMKTLTILSSTHDRFTEAVKRALEKARFAPAEFGGKKVRQVVRMPFVFSLKK